MDAIFKVVTAASLADAGQGPYAGMPVDLADGYMHFSSCDQLTETLRRHFAGQDGLVLLAVPAAALGDRLRWEPSRGGALFPHLYGPLDLSLVTHRATISVGADGAADLPDWAR